MKIMAKSILAFYCMCLSSIGLSQEFNLTEGCWLPKAYIDSLQRNPSGRFFNEIKPVRSIYVSGDTILIMSYGGEFLKAEISRTDDKKIEILNFSNLVNLVDANTDNYADAKVMLIMNGQDLMLELRRDSGIQTVRFVNSVGNFKFSNPEDTHMRFVMSGEFVLGKKKFTLYRDGRIKSDSWKAYGLLRHGYASVDEEKRSYNLVFLKDKDNKVFNFALRVESKKLEFYQYSSMDKGDYLITPMATPSFILERSQ
jgi:hypothetical protein